MKSKDLPQPKKKGSVVTQPVRGPRLLYRNVSLDIESLKGIKKAKIDLTSRLTAIMGVNGAGKTTVIHALACLYSPVDEKGTNYRFMNFFIPTNDATWQGSKLTLHYESKRPGDGAQWVAESKEYKKEADRWTRYEGRPKRNVTYLGINTCLPEIECTETNCTINYTSTKKTEPKDAKVVETASYILGKPYTALTSNTTLKKHKELMGVETSSGLKYSSLSMGTGEQRIIRILDSVYSANKGSMILIDEVDLLLHVTALKRLIVKLNEIAESRDLQIVFTTHSPEILKFDFVKVQYLSQSPNGKKTNVYDRVSYDLMTELLDEKNRPLKIYVEDTYSKCIVSAVASSLNIKKKVDIISFGSIENSFTIACSKIMEGCDEKNTVLLLDGDVLRTKDEKMKCIRERMTGNESFRKEMQERAFNMIIQYDLPEDIGPEKFLHDLVVKYGNKKLELAKIASKIIAVGDKHQWINSIIEEIGLSEEAVVPQLIGMVAESREWKKYVKPIADWLALRKSV